METKTQVPRTPVKQIGTVSIGFLLRKKTIDRKGRKRRLRVEYRVPIVTGQGGMSGINAIQVLKKELATPKESGGLVLTQPKFNKLMEIIRPKARK